MDIYSILRSKPHNPHYLSKYITFIRNCQQKNIEYKGYTESHHICPDSMFPEYMCFKNNPWNKVNLTPREHYIAHIVLEKVFDNKEMKQALFFMSNGSWKKYSNYSKRYERLRLELKPVWESNGKKVGLTTKGFAVVKDKNGNILKIPVDDYRLKTGEVVGVMKNTTIVIDSEGNTYSVSVDDYRHLSGELKGIAHGYNIVKNKEGRVLRVSVDDKRLDTGELVSINKNMMSAKDSSGKTFWISTQDPRLKTGELFSTTTGQTLVKDKEGNVLRVSVNDPRFATGAIVGMHKNTVTVKDINGNNYRVSYDDPRYISGELIPVTKGVEPPNKGLICYTNGQKNIYLSPDIKPPAGFYKGAKKKKTSVKNFTCPHCEVSSSSSSNMNRWHFNNCKKIKQQFE
jgi:ribosome maturation factor RimP